MIQWQQVRNTERVGDTYSRPEAEEQHTIEKGKAWQGKLGQGKLGQGKLGQGKLGQGKLGQGCKFATTAVMRLDVPFKENTGDS